MDISGVQLACLFHVLDYNVEAREDYGVVRRHDYWTDFEYYAPIQEYRVNRAAVRVRAFRARIMEVRRAGRDGVWKPDGITPESTFLFCAQMDQFNYNPRASRFLWTIAKALQKRGL